VFALFTSPFPTRPEGTLSDVDWYLDRAEQVGDLRRELSQYLERHGLPGSHEQIADAELIVSEAVGNAIRHTGGPVWVSLTWSTELPVLRVYDIGIGVDTGGPTADQHPYPDPDTDDLMAESGRGLLIIQALAPR